jgi:hypothetical protein
MQPMSENCVMDLARAVRAEYCCKKYKVKAVDRGMPIRHEVPLEPSLSDYGSRPSSFLLAVHCRCLSDRRDRSLSRLDASSF